MATEPRQLDSAGPRRRFQFGLRAMFVWVAALCVLFALMAVLGVLWSVALVWFLLLVAAHVIGNAWGTKVNDRRECDAGCEDRPAPQTIFAARPTLCGPSAHMWSSARLGWIMLAVTSSGAAIGGALGTTLLAAFCPSRVGVAGLVVGGISSAVVGGFVGFLASSFGEVAARAWFDAADSRPPASTRERT